MALKLVKVAEAHWRKLNGFEYLAKIITGVRFADGIEVRDDSPVRTTPAVAGSITTAHQIRIFLTSRAPVVWSVPERRRTAE